MAAITCGHGPRCTSMLCAVAKLQKQDNPRGRHNPTPDYDRHGLPDPIESAMHGSYKAFAAWQAGVEERARDLLGSEWAKGEAFDPRCGRGIVGHVNALNIELRRANVAANMGRFTAQGLDKRIPEVTAQINRVTDIVFEIVSKLGSESKRQGMQWTAPPARAPGVPEAPFAQWVPVQNVQAKVKFPNGGHDGQGVCVLG